MREDEILERLNGGDASALDELVRAYYPDILRYCRRHSPDEASAEDAAQETFLKAVRHLDAHAFRGRFRAWLYKIAANTCADRCRRETPAEPLSDSPYIDPGFERTELFTGPLSSSAEGFKIGGESYAFHEMSLPEILSGGRRMEFTCGKRSYMLEKENACLNKYVELYKWATGREE